VPNLNPEVFVETNRLVRFGELAAERKSSAAGPARETLNPG